MKVFFENEEINPFMAAGANGMNIDDFNGDNFDHGGLGFFGGALNQPARPMAGRSWGARRLPAHPRWGRDWKKATAKWYNHGFTIGASGAISRTGIIIWTSIRPIEMRSVGR